ncbi:MAG: pteridine reductase [Pseudomonadota bacterium]
MSATRLDQRVVLITGAARRVGAASARYLHNLGARIAIHYRASSTDADALAAELNATRPDSAIAVQADLINLDTHAALIERVVSAFGHLDVLVNNASTYYPTPVGTMTDAHWNDLMGSNLKAPLFLSQAAAPALAARRGLIVNIEDINASRPLKSFTLYCCAKAGTAMLTQSLAVELGPDVRVNGIAPGPILWPEHEVSDADKASVIDSTLLKRTGEPLDIARALAFLIADASFVTGQSIAVDGGRSLRGA